MAELYSQEWGGGMNISDLLVKAAPYGGPIAITWPQDGKKVSQSPRNPVIFVFSAAGKRLGTIQVME